MRVVMPISLSPRTSRFRQNAPSRPKKIIADGRSFGHPREAVATSGQLVSDAASVEPACPIAALG